MNRLGSRMRQEQGELSSWLLLALGVAVAASVAVTHLEPVVNELAADAGEVVRTSASQYTNPIPIAAGAEAVASYDQNDAVDVTNLTETAPPPSAASPRSSTSSYPAGPSGAGGPYPRWDGSPITAFSGRDLSGADINRHLRNGKALSDAEVRAAYADYNRAFGLIGAGVWRSSDPAERFAPGRDPNSYHLIGSGMDIGSQTSINQLGRAEAQARMAAFARWAAQHVGPGKPFDSVLFGNNRHHHDHVHIDINPNWSGPLPRP